MSRRLGVLRRWLRHDDLPHQRVRLMPEGTQTRPLRARLLQADQGDPGGRYIGGVVRAHWRDRAVSFVTTPVVPLWLFTLSLLAAIAAWVPWAAWLVAGALTGYSLSGST